jgi:hypothetical protein
MKRYTEDIRRMHPDISDEKIVKMAKLSLSLFRNTPTEAHFLKEGYIPEEPTDEELAWEAEQEKGSPELQREVDEEKKARSQARRPEQVLQPTKKKRVLAKPEDIDRLVEEGYLPANAPALPDGRIVMEPLD